MIVLLLILQKVSSHRENMSVYKSMDNRSVWFPYYLCIYYLITNECCKAMFLSCNYSYRPYIYHIQHKEIEILNDL